MSKEKLDEIVEDLQGKLPVTHTDYIALAQSFIQGISIGGGLVTLALLIFSSWALTSFITVIMMLLLGASQLTVTLIPKIRAMLKKDDAQKQPVDPDDVSEFMND